MQLFKVADSQIPKQDPELFKLVPVKVLRSFCVAGKVQAIGDIVKIERHLAAGLQSLGKAEVIG